VVDTYTSAGMSEYDRALRLYNWLCANAAYDDSAADNDIWSSEYAPYSPEGALLGGWAVCQGYAEAYELLLEEAGITAHLVRGKAEYNGGGHAWNIAKIDGSWYQFDPTWDEAGNGSTHNYFGLCDAAMRSDHIQESAGHLTCNSYAANYKYVNGSYNSALGTITDTINTSISAGAYTGTISGLTSLFYRAPDPYMVACIINQADDWAISGRAEIVPDESASTFSFTFYPDEIPVSEIIIHNLEDLEPESGHRETQWYAYPGYSIQMQATTVPAGAPITYASSNESVLTISQDGLVTAIAEGTAVITVSSGSCIRKINIAVYDQASFYLHLFGVSGADVGETIQCTPYGRYHLFLADNSLLWSSSDESVAVVDENGLVTAIGYGSAAITVQTATGYSDTVILTVCKPVTAVYFDQEIYDAFVGQNLIPLLRVEGCDQDIYNDLYGYVSCRSSDDVIADCVGYLPPRKSSDDTYWLYPFYIECLAPGEVTITAYAADGSGVTATCTVIVREAPQLTAIRFEHDVYNLHIGDQIIFNAYAEGEDPDFYSEMYQTFNYTSSDAGVADRLYSYYPSWNPQLECWEYSVAVEALAPGEVTFTATAKDGSGVTGSCTIRVWEHADSMSLSPAQLILNAGGTGSQRRLRCTFEPETGFEHVSWSSSAPAVVSVDETGLLTAGAPGTAVITAMTGTGLRASCTVTVQNLQGLLLPASLTAIEAEAFAGLALPQTVTIPEGTLTIGENAFRGCNGLLYVSLPGSLSYIAESAFDGCSGLLILCEEGSYAHSWCIDNGAAFDLR